MLLFFLSYLKELPRGGGVTGKISRVTVVADYDEDIDCAGSRLRRGGAVKKRRWWDTDVY